MSTRQNSPIHVPARTTALPLAGGASRLLSLTMLAASSFLINIREGGRDFPAFVPDVASKTPSSRLNKGGCFLCGGTLTVTCASPTFIDGGNFVGGALGRLQASQLKAETSTLRSMFLSLWFPYSCFLFSLDSFTVSKSSPKMKRYVTQKELA